MVIYFMIIFSFSVFIFPCRYRLVVRTLGSHPRNPGSIPGSGTIMLVTGTGKREGIS